MLSEVVFHLKYGKVKGSSMEKRGKRQSASIFGGMGFYIALLVCVLAAGVVGYYALLNVPSDEPDPVPDPLPVADELPRPAAPVISDQPVVIDVPEEEEPAQPVGDNLPVEVPEEEAAPVMETETSPPVYVPQPEETEQVVSPLAGETVAVFSVDALTYDATLGDWRTHDGIDIRAAAGTEVVSAAKGTVLSVEDDGRMGTTVVIQHENGYVTTYASLQPDTAVLPGDSVKAGTVIGTVGNTSLAESALGAHLHFSVSRDGEVIDPMDFLE